MSRVHLGKRTLSLPRLLCSVDVVVVVTFPPFCSDRVVLFLMTLLTGVVTAVKTNSLLKQFPPSQTCQKTSNGNQQSAIASAG